MEFGCSPACGRGEFTATSSGRGIAMRFRVKAIDSMPERPEVTRQIEAMKRQQDEDDKKASAQSNGKQTVNVSQ